MVALLFYLGLAGILTLEEAGVFLLPGDISLVAAGVHAAQGDSVIFISWMVATLAMVAGSSVLFHGVARSNRMDRLLPERVRKLVQRHGIWGVAVARLVPGLRNATVFAAASSDLPYRKFVIGLAPAALVWTGALLALGWFGGGQILILLHAFHAHRSIKVVTVALFLSAAILIVLRIRHTSAPQSVP